MKPAELVALLERFAASGDEEAMEEFVRRTRPRLLGTARRIAGADAAEDAVQTAYHSLLRRGTVPRPRPLAWLTTAVIRIAYRHVAKRRREAELALRLAREVPPIRDDPETERVRREVDRLPALYRDVVVLHYLEGLTAAECGRLLALTPAAVRQRLKRARDLLRSRLSPRATYALLWLPWRLRDTAALWTGGTLGGIMKGRLALTAAIFLLALGGTFAVWRATHRPQASQPERTTSNRTNRQDETQNDNSKRTAMSPKTGHSDEPAQPFAQGLVTDESGAPLADVHVLLRGVDPFTSQEQPAWMQPSQARSIAVHTTGADGRFEVPEPLDKMFGLVFLKRGLAGLVVNVATDRADNQELRVTLYPAMRYSGTVVDTDRRPIAMAKVAVWQHDQTGVGQYEYADAQGRFSFDSLAEGSRMTMAAATGYKHEMGAITEGAEIRLQRAAILIHVAAEETGAPLNAAGVVVLREPGQRWVTAARRPDNKNGFRVVPGLLTVSLGYVQAIRQSAVELELHVFAPGFRTRVHRLRLEKGAEPPVVRMRLSPGQDPATIRCLVEGPPTAAWELRGGVAEKFVMNDADLPLLFSGETSGGRFTIAAPPGRYRLLVEAPGHASRALDVRAPAAQDIAVRLLPACGLTVQTKPGAPVHVEVIGEDKRAWNERADDKGVARFDGLLPGKARLALIPGTQWYGRGDWWSRIEPQASVTLVSGQTAAVTLMPPERAAATIVIRDGDGPARAGLALELTARSGHGIFAENEWQRVRGPHATDASGRLAIDLFPGEYTVTVTDGSTRFKRRLEVKGDGTHEVTIAQGGARLHGRVIAAGLDGKPLANLPVYVAWADASKRRGWLGQSVTDARGRFEIRGLRPGKVGVYVYGNSTPQGLTRAESPFGTATRLVALAANTALEVDFALPRLRGKNAAPRPVRLRATVTDNDGRPLADAIVHAEVDREGTWFAAGSLRTSEQGQASASVLDGERFRVRAYKSGYGSATATVSPTNGELTAELSLQER